MSWAPYEATNVRDAGIGDDQYPPQSAPNQASHRNFVDGSGPIFSMYLERAEEEDRKMVERWKADADGALIFSGLFSAAIATLISISIQDLRPDPQDTSNFYLENIYQTLTNPNRSSILTSYPSSPRPFSPPSYAIWVNGLWFFSLANCIACATFAALLQQWARKYLKVTQAHYSPHKRARIRTFFFEGSERLLLPWVVEALPMLLHVSLILCGVGIVVFLYQVSLTGFKLSLTFVSVASSLYACLTLMPVFHHDSPYHTPLSLPAWHIATGTSCIAYRFLRWCTWLVHSRDGSLNQFRGLEEGHRRLLTQGMQKTAEEAALKAPSEIDTHAFLWTFDGLDEDDELERFFSGLPGFRNSKIVDDPLRNLTEEGKKRISEALIGFLDRTFSSDILPEPVKNRRAVVCARALDPAEFPDAYDHILRIVFQDQYRGLQTAEFARVMRGWGNSGDQNTALVVQAIVTGIVAKAQRRNDSWFVLASSELGTPETVLRYYAARGDSLSLAVLIHLTRQQFNRFSMQPWPSTEFSFILEAASKFNARDTLLELQHEFCALWNQIVLKVHNDNDQRMALLTLGPIRNIYFTLHQDAGSAPTLLSPSTGNGDNILREPSSYPTCNDTGHIRDDLTSTTLGRPVLQVRPDVPPLLIPASLPIVGSPRDVPPLGDFHPAQKTSIEGPIPVISPGPAIAGSIRDVAPSGITMPYPSPETSTSTIPLSSTSISIPHNAYLPTSPYPASNTALDNTLPTGPSLSPHALMTRFTVSPSCPESHPSIITAPNISLERTSASDGGGKPKPGLHNEKDAFDPPSVNRATHTTPDLSPQSRSLPSVTDSGVAVGGRSLRGPSAERTGDHYPHPSHCRYDIV